MSQVHADSILTKSLYLVPRADHASAATPPTNGLAVPSTALVKAGPFLALTTAPIDTVSAGIKVSHVFKVVIPQSCTLAGRFRFRVVWEVTANVGASTATIRPSVKLRKNGADIGGLTPGVGKANVVTALATFVDNNIEVVLPTTQFSAGDTLEFVVSLETVATYGAGNPNVQVHCDPATGNKELICEPDLGVA